MLPKNVISKLKSIYRPNNRNENSVKEFEQLFPILTVSEAQKILDLIGIKNKNTFYEYYSSFMPSGSVFREEVDLLYDLDEIYEDYKNPYWKIQYPNLTDRYLQISSIEGEHSYFYDKETDAVYSVNWSQMDDFVAGKLEPMFNSFYDFLEWYYEED